MSELTKIGLPIALSLFIEFLGFNIIAVLLGRFEPVYTACHNIIITITSLAYMVPFSLSCALSVKVGFANGNKNILDVKNYTLSAIYFIVFYSIIVALCYIFFKSNLISFFTKDKLLIQTGSNVMLIVACFTLFDGIQGVCMGALKGIKQTFKMFVVMASSYLLIGIPLGLLFAYKFNLILEGFWLGLAFALLTASISSSLFFTKKYFKLKSEFNNL